MRNSIAVGLAMAGAVLAQTAGRRALITQTVDESRLVRLAGNTRPEAIRENDLGMAPDDLHLDMYLQLKRSPEQELSAQQFVESLTDKSSPNFHKWIAAAEYGQRFGAASDDIATISRWLGSHGFTVNGVPANDMVIDFSGNAGQVREAMHTEIHYLNVAGARHFANMSDPQIPEALLPAVTGVVSLNNFRPRPMLKPRAQYTVNSQEIPLVPADVATIYNLNGAFAGGFTGLGQTIVVIEDTDLYSGNDWTTFRKTFGLAAQYPYGTLTQTHPSPGCSDPGINGDDAEAALDVEWASAAAPNAAIVMASCYGTTNFGGFIALQNLLTNGGALPGVVSISYGAPETENGSAMNSYVNTLYQTAAAAGVSVFVSSGDSDAALADDFQNVAIHGVSVSGFADTIYNVAVGGTDFGDFASNTTGAYWNTTNGPYYISAKSYVREMPWNDSCGSTVLANYLGYSAVYGPAGLCNSAYEWLDTDGGSGGPSGCATGYPALSNVVGGTCAGYAKPAWQSIFGNPSDGVRDLPDVSLFASDGFWGHYYVFCITDGASCTGAPAGWAGGGGTSFSSPIMAGIQALINQALGTTNVGNPNPTYYQIAKTEYAGAASRTACNSTTGPAAGCAFNDVTQGDSAVPCAGTFNCYLGGGGIGVLSASDTAYEPAYATAAGWDFATGIGTVNAFNLLAAFVDSTAPTSAPAAPALASPANGATGVLPGTALGWSVSVGATSYDVYLGTAATPGLAGNVTDIGYVPAGLSPGTTYYWAVGARNSLGANESAAWSFTTSCVSALSLSSATAPAAGGTGTIPVAASPGCGWTAVSNAAWIAIDSGATGSGNGTVSYAVAADTGAARTGTITVAGQTFTVTQAIYPVISTLAGGAMAATAAAGAAVSIPVLYGVAVDSAGNTYFASPNQNAVFRADGNGVVLRIAGTGAAEYLGDGGPALSAPLNNPNGVAVDSRGNVYIADTGNGRIRKVDPTGTITTVAGNGGCCATAGDGLMATSAEFGLVYGVAVDGSGNLYLADSTNNVIRRVTASGAIATVAGNGTYGYMGDGGPATSAELKEPWGVAADAAGNLYIVDRYNLRIRMVSTSGTINTVAGDGNCCYSGDGGPATSAELFCPTGVAVDAAGNLYVADNYNSRIRKVSVSGTIATVAGNGNYGYAGDGGPAASAEMAYAGGVAVDAAGNLYIADYGNARIRKVSAGGTMGTLVGGALGDSGLGALAALNAPSGVARDNAGNTYISDTNDNRVRVVAANGTITTMAGTGVAGFAGDGGAAASAQLNAPRGLAVDGAGNLYIADAGNYLVRKVSSVGTITTVAGNGVCCGHTGDGGPATAAQIGAPYWLAVDGAGNLYIADNTNCVIRKVTAGGTISTVAGNGTCGYLGDGGPATGAEMRNPDGVAVDGTGNLYIADAGNYRIRRVSGSGTITTVAGTGNCCYAGDGGPALLAELDDPTGVTVDASGDLYIADSGNNRIREVGANGTITTVAGNGIPGYSGDGGPATGANLRAPYGIAVDAAGNVAVTDQSNNAVRLLTPAGGPSVLTVASTHAGNFTVGGTGAYTVSVNNAATAGATGGTVTVTEIPQAVLTVTGMSGPGWSCSGNACTRGDSLIGGASYPPITVAVSVGVAVEPQATNIVTVSGGAGVAAAEDLTTIPLPSLLGITKTHGGSFMQGQNGAAYTVTVSNVGAAGATSGAVTVMETPPAGLTLVSMAGTGWTCAAGSCSRSDGLAAGASYPPIAVTVNVASNAASPQVNAVSVSGGGSAPASATDSTMILGPCVYTLNYGGQAFPLAGGTGIVGVTTSSSGCAWTASSGASWVAITGGASGTGSGTVTYQAAANAGAARSGSLTVAGLPFTVQEASATAVGLAAAGSMAQLASGGLWNTTITLLNTGAAAEVVLNFYDDNGNALPLPLTFPEGPAGAAPILASTLDQTIGAGAQLTVQTAGLASQATTEGWAQVMANGGSVGGSAVFAWTTVTGAQEAVAPVETRNASAFVLPFDYTGGYQTGIALANLSNKAAIIPVVLTDNTGASLGAAAAIQLPAYAHTSFMLAGSYPAVVGKMGAVELDTPAGGQISALGIRATPGGAITSVPVLVK